MDEEIKQAIRLIVNNIGYIWCIEHQEYISKEDIAWHFDNIEHEK